MRIYLIDDDEVSIFLFKSTMKLLDPHQDIRTFLSARELLKELDQHSLNEYPDALFVDLSMPVMDGWELLEELQRRYPGLAERCRVYILTSSIRESDEVRGKTHPIVNGFLSKPLKKEIIQNILSNYLSEARR